MTTQGFGFGGGVKAIDMRSYWIGATVGLVSCAVGNAASQLWLSPAYLSYEDCWFIHNQPGNVCEKYPRIFPFGTVHYQIPMPPERGAPG